MSAPTSETELRELALEDMTNVRERVASMVDTFAMLLEQGCVSDKFVPMVVELVKTAASLDAAIAVTGTFWGMAPEPTIASRTRATGRLPTCERALGCGRG